MRNRQSTANTVLNTVATHNPYGEYIRPLYLDNNVVLEVECGGNNGLLYLSKLCQGSKGPCILYRDMWLTPNEFQYVSGRETAKDWKRSIRHYGKSMKLLLSKGILAVHPPVCDCTGCRISSPVNRNRLEEKLTPEQVTNGYYNTAITSTSQTSPGNPFYKDCIEEIKDLIKTNKTMCKSVSIPTNKKPNGEKIHQKLSTEVKKESRLTSIIDQLLINKTKTLNQCDEKKTTTGNEAVETNEVESSPIDTAGFSGSSEEKPVAVPTITEVPTEQLHIETNVEPERSSMLLDSLSVNKTEEQPLLEDGEIQRKIDYTQIDHTNFPKDYMSEIADIYSENLNRDFDSDGECSSSEEEVQSQTEFNSMPDHANQSDNFADALPHCSQLNANQNDVSVKTERVSPDLEVANCDLSTRPNYNMASWTKQQMETFTRSYNRYIRNLSKYNSLPSLPSCFLMENRPIQQTMVDRQTHSSPPMYGDIQLESGQNSNLVRTSSTSTLENYLRAPTKRSHGGEHRSDPLDLTTTTTKKSRVEEPLAVDNIFMPFVNSQSCDNKTMGIDPEKSTGSMRCLSLCTQQTCPDQSEGSESVDVTQWSVEDVVQFVTSIESCTDYAEKFREHCIDGTILPLLTEDHLTYHLGMKLGPALKLRSSLAKLIDHCVICMHCIHCHGENQKNDVSLDNK